jgi:[ribosomal protein S5]-alanine N-acetyltransferase
VLHARRLVLRELTRADVPQILDISFFQGTIARSLAEAEQMQQWIRREYEQGTLLHWGYTLGADGPVVGTGGFYRSFKPESPDTAEIGYVLLPAYRGQGLATEAVETMVEYGFQTLGLHRVLAFTDPLNVASQAVLRRAGFQELTHERPLESKKFGREAPGLSTH